MAAAVLKGPGRLDIEEVPVPDLGDDDVLVAVELCGVCGTDLHLVLDGWGAPGSRPGHEWIGRVAAVGPAVERWEVGDAVIGGPAGPCGACPSCRAGRSSLCEHRDEPGAASDDGAFATYKAAPAGGLLPVPDGLDPRAAALAEPLAVALHAITRSGIRPGQRSLVLGAGPIGALCIAALRALSVDDVTCAEPGLRRQALAHAVGATAVLHPDDLEVPTMAEPGRVVEGAADVVLECSGRAAAMEAGLAQLQRGGALVLVGAGIERPQFNPIRILLNELVVTGAFNYDDDGFQRALDLLASGALPVDALLEPGDVPLDGILDAMHGLVDGRLAGKVLVRP